MSQFPLFFKKIKQFLGIFDNLTPIFLQLLKITSVSRFKAKILMQLQCLNLRAISLGGGDNNSFDHPVQAYKHTWGAKTEKPQKGVISTKK